MMSSSDETVEIISENEIIADSTVIEEYNMDDIEVECVEYVEEGPVIEVEVREEVPPKPKPVVVKEEEVKPEPPKPKRFRFQKKSPEDKLEEKLKRQNSLEFEVRSMLKNFLTDAAMEHILRENGISLKFGPEENRACEQFLPLDILVDCVLFGKPAPCPECSNGQIIYSVSDRTYVCLGYVSEYTKCTYTNKNPLRSPFQINAYHDYDDDWLKHIKVNALFAAQRTYRNESEGSADNSPAPSIVKVIDNASSSTSSAAAEGRKCKQVIKNGTIIDGEFERAAEFHVHKDEEGNLYATTLSWADVMSNTNSVYKISLLKHDNKNEYVVFCLWGRVGGTMESSEEIFDHDRCQSYYLVVDPMDKAERRFRGVFLEKTGNNWEDRKYFLKKPGKYNLVETDYSEFRNVDTESVVKPGSVTKLHRSIKELLMMIFDVENMKKSMKQFELDLDKMPVGKLSKKQILSAFSVLKDLEETICNGKKDARLIQDLTNRFYTFIPHYFGLQAPVLLDSLDKIKNKTSMLNSLLEIELAHNVLVGEKGELAREGEDPVDVHYRKLRCDMEHVPSGTEEFKMVECYLRNTHGKTHNFRLELVDLIRVSRAGESEKFQHHLGNRMLLWHGSRVSNFGGILSQGLRIAPPEAPSTGYMFGKGVYFADMVSKSANYCRVQQWGQDALLLLCEVALGQTQEEKHAFDNGQTLLREGYQSVKGVGITYPSPAEARDYSGCKVPLGKSCVDNKSKHGTDKSLLYNEYIVYNEDQVKMRYIVRTRFLQQKNHK